MARQSNKNNNQNRVEMLSHIPDDIIKQISSGVKTQADLMAVIHSLKSRIIESALNAEMDYHLLSSNNSHNQQNSISTEVMDDELEDDLLSSSSVLSQTNRRNGYSSKTVKTDSGDIPVNVPRDRNSEFEPMLIEKHKRRLEGIDGAVLALYSRGMSVRDIKATISDLYQHDLSEDLISQITESVTEEVREWQNRPLDECYPIVYLDCIVVKVHENKSIINKSVYLALGVNTSGVKELLGMYIAQNEGSKFWLNVLTELNNRGVKDIFIACCDGLKGFPDAINAVYPSCDVQLCIVHMTRNSLNYVSYKDKKELAADLKNIYQATTEEIAYANLDEFAKKWDEKYPAISKSWYNNWVQVKPMFEYSKEIRKAIYTTNAIESLNMTLRKVTKNKRSFPNDGSVFKTLYLAINNIAKRWTMPIREWGTAYQQMLIKFGKI